jgi:hypothetical protein
MEVSGQLHSPSTLTPESEPPAPNGLEGGWMGPRICLDIRRKEKSPAPAGYGTRYLCRPARGLVPIPTELFWPNVSILPYKRGRVNTLSEMCGSLCVNSLGHDDVESCRCFPVVRRRLDPLSICPTTINILY